jgi:hypothetical protein
MSTNTNETVAFIAALFFTLAWNVFIWGAFLYLVVEEGWTAWSLIVPALLTVFPKSKPDEQD